MSSHEQHQQPPQQQQQQPPPPVQQMDTTTDNSRAQRLSDVPGSTIRGYVCHICQDKRYLDCDYNRRKRNEELGSQHPEYDPGLVLPCSNCRHYGGSKCECKPSMRTMFQALKAAMRGPAPSTVPEPRPRVHNPMARVSAAWTGSPNSTQPPPLPQDVVNDADGTLGSTIEVNTRQRTAQMLQRQQQRQYGYGSMPQYGYGSQPQYQPQYAPQHTPSWNPQGQGQRQTYGGVHWGSAPPTAPAPAAPPAAPASVPEPFHFRAGPLQEHFEALPPGIEMEANGVVYRRASTLPPPPASLPPRPNRGPGIDSYRPSHRDRNDRGGRDRNDRGGGQTRGRGGNQRPNNDTSHRQSPERPRGMSDDDDSGRSPKRRKVNKSESEPKAELGGSTSARRRDVDAGVELREQELQRIEQSSSGTAPTTLDRQIQQREAELDNIQEEPMSVRDRERALDDLIGDDRSPPPSMQSPAADKSEEDKAYEATKKGVLHEYADSHMSSPSSPSSPKSPTLRVPTLKEFSRMSGRNNPVDDDNC